MTTDQILQSPYFSVAIAVLTSAIVAAIRHYRPVWWASLPPRVQVVPAAVVALVLSTATTGTRVLLDGLQAVGADLMPVLAQWGTDAALGWIGAMGTQQAAKRVRPAGAPPSAGTTTRIVGGLIVMLVAILTLPGCSALRTANDARLDLCDKIGEERQDTEAQRLGMSPAEWLALWRATCLIRVQRAEDEAIGSVGAAP